MADDEHAAAEFREAFLEDCSVERSRSFVGSSRMRKIAAAQEDFRDGEPAALSAAE